MPADALDVHRKQVFDEILRVVAFEEQKQTLNGVFFIMTHFSSNGLKQFSMKTF